MIYGCSPYFPIEASIVHGDFSAMTPNGPSRWEIWGTVDSIESLDSSLDESHEDTYPSTSLGSPKSPANLLLKLWEHKHVDFFSTDDVPILHRKNKKNILHTLW